MFEIMISYFFLNLFVGMMFTCFITAYNKECLLCDKKNQIWIDLMVQIPKSTTMWESQKCPSDKYKKFFYYVAVSKHTEIFVMVLTFLNLVVLAIDYENSPEILAKITDIINTIIVCFIILEVIVKIIGLNFEGYFSSNWNRFDFFIAITSIIDLYFSSSTEIDNSVKILKNFQILRIIRMIRVTR